MTRSMKYFKGQFSHFKSFAIFSNMRFKRRHRSWSIHNGCTSCFGQVNMTRNKVGMKMGFKNILNPGAIFFCFFDIWRNFTQRIYNNGFPFAFNVVSSLS